MNKPNILILFSDQQRYDTIHAAGYEHMITPHLDRLAAEGTLFLNAHTGNPVCMPARHDLMTGFPARVHGYYSNANRQRMLDETVPTLASIFSEHDYRTVAVGKMHFWPTRKHHGFDEMLLMEELPKIRQQDQYSMFLQEEGLGHVQNIHGVRPHIYHIPQNAQTDEAHHGTTWVANTAINWLESNKENPFMMMCGFIQPHPPWNNPLEFDGIYDEKDIPDVIPLSRLPMENEDMGDWFGDNDTKKQKETIRKAYYTAITMVDKNVGRIVDYLREKGQLDNTLVIFSSDHGEMLQDKGYYSKELPYDSAVRVPLIMRYPEKVQANVKNASFVDLLDVLPTCLDACGIAYSDKRRELFGRSLFATIDKEYQFSATGNLPSRWVMCRNVRFKYVYHYMGGFEELYDTDCNEVDNLLMSPITAEYEDMKNKLKARALAYESEWGIEGGVENGAFTVCETTTVHPAVHGKFHFWSNLQMQSFHECDLYKRGETLQNEMRYALSNEEKSGVALEAVFNDKTWKADFQKSYVSYTNHEEGEGDFPFKNESKPISTLNSTDMSNEKRAKQEGM